MRKTEQYNASKLSFQYLQHSFEDIANVDTVCEIQLFDVDLQDGAIVKAQLDNVRAIALVPMIQVFDLVILPAAFDLHLSATLLDAFPS